MTQADRVLSTPPLITSLNNPDVSAPGAVQFSSPPLIFTSPAAACQGVKNTRTFPRFGDSFGRVSRRAFMNSIVEIQPELMAGRGVMDRNEIDDDLGPVLN